jgi:hypothetical protein
MDFFNKLGAKAEETYQTVKNSNTTKKALNYAEIPGLSMQVGKQESIVKKAYEEIGEAYYESHKDNPGELYADQMQRIAEALSKIDELKKEIEEKKKYDPEKDNSENVVSAEETAQSSVVVPSDVVE